MVDPVWEWDDVVVFSVYSRCGNLGLEPMPLEDGFAEGIDEGGVRSGEHG